MSKVDFSIKEILRVERKDLVDSQLDLLITGKSINCAVVNTLRRMAAESVPTYGFSPDPAMIDITFNDTIHDNDDMRNYLSNLAIPNLRPKPIFLSETYWNVNYADPEHEKHPEDDLNIQLIIKAHNDTNSLMKVTTNDVTYVENMEIVKGKFNPDFPSLIIKLRPNQSFRCTMRASLSVGERDNRWSAVSNSYFDEKGPHQYLLTLKSLGQMDEYEIIVKCCMITVKRLESLKVLIGSEFKKHNFTTNKKVMIELENEDHTMGNLLSRTIQDRPEVLHASYSKPDHHKKEIVLKVTSMDNAVGSVFSSIKYLQQLFSEMEQSLRSLGKRNKIDLKF